MRPDGQYTLDADPMVLAKRVETLEHVCDSLCAALHDLATQTRVIADQCEKALCEDRPLQADALNKSHDRLTHVCNAAHAAGQLMGRSY